MRIRNKIIVPFTLLFAVSIVGTAVISATVITRVFERNLETQLEVVSKLVSASDFSMNRAILERVKSIVTADIVTYDSWGAVIVSTLTAEAESAWMGLLPSPNECSSGSQTDGGWTILDTDLDGVPYSVICRPVLNAAGTYVALLRDTSDIAKAKRSVVQPMVPWVLATIVLMSIISQVVARGITSPLARLAEGTRRLSAGDWTASLKVETSDEVGEVTHSFNAMAEDLRRSEEKLLQTEKLALAGQLAARVAHDIRTPMSSIKMRVQLLTKRLERTNNIQAMGTILADIDRVERVVQGLLDLSAPIEIRLRESDINEVIAGVLESVDAQMKHSRIIVEMKLAPETRAVMLGREHFEQGLLNVIENACDAMPAGGRLRVETLFDASCGTVEIWLEDEGVGISPEASERLFEPFFTTKREGVGLGLINTKHIVDRHDGTIDFFAREGGGTRVVITLPLVAMKARTSFQVSRVEDTTRQTS